MTIRNVFAAAALIAGSLPSLAAAQVNYIDTHTHLHGVVPRGQFDFAGAAGAALKSADEFGAARLIVMPPPLSPGHPRAFDADELLDGTKAHRGRFAVSAGGGSLNPMILQAVRSGSLSDADKKRFTEKAEQLAAKPIVGFGEFTTEHFSLGPDHPYITAPADHPLYLILADVAAKHQLPIDLHMEAVETATSLNPKYRPPNPAKLEPNIAGLERLLAHNRQARIIWTHAGWDNTGQRTPDLTRRLFAAHPNLYVSVKQGPENAATRFFERDSEFAPAWLAVIKEFPDRFLPGTDQFHLSPRADTKFPRHPATARQFLDKLPPELARRIGVDNPLTVFPRLRN